MASSSESGEDGKSVLDLLEDWYHVPALLVVVATMLWIRLQSYDNFVRGGEILFSGNDAWYHLREVRYTVRNWPMNIPFDPWTYFPYGTSVGQFGTLYDQLIATAALVVGLGGPGETLVAETLLVAPAVFGALAAVPTYFIGKRLAGRFAGVVAAVVLALQPGVFLSRTLVGVADHNAAEPLFQALAVLGLLGMLTTVEREKPVWELLVDRDVDGLRPTLLWSAVAGVATALYVWVWPPGVLLIGLFGLFVVLKLSSDVVNGRSPEPVALGTALSMGVTAVLLLVPLQTLGFTPTSFSLLQPGIAVAIAAGAAFMAWLARTWGERDLDPWLYPVVVLAAILLGLGLVAVLLPGTLSVIQRNLLRTVGFSAGAETRTIGEAQPYLAPTSLRQLRLTPTNRIISDYGFTLFTGIAGAVWLLGRPLVKHDDIRRLGFAVGSLVVVGLLFLIPAIPDGIGAAVGVDSSLVGLGIVTAVVVGAALLVDHDADHLFVLVWAAFITSAAFTQTRFNYYLAVPVAVMNAFLIGQFLEYLDLRSLPRRASEVKGYQVVVVLAVLMLVFAPVLLVPIDIRDTGNAQFDRSNTAWEAGQGNTPGGITQWDGTLQWMNAQTPAEGELGGADSRMEYYGTYTETDDFSYSEGSYGVMSWWDYGHWITVRGERIPNANPFQQGATTAANYLLAPNETRAENVLRDESTEGNRTRFVMVDWQMVEPTSKFGAPTVFYDEGNISQADFYEQIYSQEFQQSFQVRHQRYYDSQMIRLYEYHGSARGPSPVVVDWDEVSARTQAGETVEVKTVPQDDSSVVKEFNSTAAAREFVREDGSAQLGGIGSFPSERVPALEHYRLVKVSNTSAFNSRSYQQAVLSTSRMTGVPPNALVSSSPSWVKSFERVPGATVEGSGAPANANVTATVEMEVPTTDSTFQYTQRARADQDGEFELTLPYSTDGYAEYGPGNGYTNVSVRANGTYTVRTTPQLNDSGWVVSHSSELSVPEGAVNGDGDGTLSVELDRQAQELQVGNTSAEGSAESLDAEPIGSSAGADHAAPPSSP